MKKIIIAIICILFLLAARNLHSQYFVTFPVRQIQQKLNNYEVYALISEGPIHCCDGIIIYKFANTALIKSTFFNKEAMVAISDSALIQFLDALEGERVREIPNNKKTMCLGNEYYYVHRYVGGMTRKYLGCASYEDDAYQRIIDAFMTLSEQKLFDTTAASHD